MQPDLEWGYFGGTLRRSGRATVRHKCSAARCAADKLKALERENRELRQANEILRKASAYFAQAERANTLCARTSDDRVYR